MLQGLFNYDNPVWRFIGKLGDLIVLNILWTICSIPIFTIGASTTAVYYVTLKLVRDEDDSTIKAFFRSFKSNFKHPIRTSPLVWHNGNNSIRSIYNSCFLEKIQGQFCCL